MNSIIRKLNNSNVDPCNENITLETEVKPAQAWFHLSSADRPIDQPITNFVLNKKNFDKYNLYGVISMGLDFVQYYWNHPPVCPRNNIVDIKVGATTHRGTMPTGWYTQETFATALNTMFGAMVPVLGAGILTAAISPDVDGRRLTITATQAYSIERVSELKRDLGAVMGYGRKYGVVNPIGVTASHLELWYTRRIDIVSDVLGQFNKVSDESSSQISPNTVGRIFRGGGHNSHLFDKPAGTSGYEYAPKTLDIPVDPLKWFKWTPQTSITGIDLKLVDEFGDPPYLVDDQDTPDYNLIFILRGLR